MKTCKVNPLKTNQIVFHSEEMKDGMYHMEQFYSNGLGASIVCHNNSYGGHAGRFEIAIKQYQHGTDPVMTGKVVVDHPIAKRHHCVEVIPWLDFGEVDAITKEIRNYNTGDYCYNG